MVDFIRSDLEFILQQIKIAEAHAAGTPLYGPGGQIPAYNIHWGLRTVDGSYNHLLPGQERWGASDVEFPTLLDPVYRPADGTAFDPDGPGGAPPMPTAPNYNPSNDPDSLVFDSSLRTISNLLVDQTLGNPAAILEGLDRAGSADPFADLAAITVIYQAFKPASDAEYQARVVKQNAETAAVEADDGDPGTTTPAEAAAAAALAAATAAHDVTVADLDAARVVRDAALAPYGIAMDGDNVHLPNISPDGGLSASFNSWFTLFGQFFDHGLDLVAKGGSGTVFIPLQPDDPLYVEGSHTNFMVLTRATVSAGEDGIMGTADDVGPVNNTTSFVDQNQTYASHSSHQVFLRQYMVNADGEPVATGKLIEGAGGSPGGMATWGEVKAQALMLGILLTDDDVGNVPLLRTDQYGNFIPNADGYAQVITGIGLDGIPNTADDVVISGTPDAPVGLAAAIRTGHAFLADIAHTAVPNGLEDGDITIGLLNPGNNPLVYDDELLDAHFMAGDGRVNENVGLTAVHHVFHAEHNRLVDHTKEVTLADAAAMLAGGASQADAVAFLNEWLIDDVTSVPDTPAEIAALVWDGERLFQAARFGNEMQYQHLVFEEFARKIQPQVDAFIVPDGFDTTINPDIVAEFAHVVYRFGHSMLTEDIDRFGPTFTPNDISLIDGFLNPVQFNGVNGAIEDGLAAGDIIRGMTRQVGNEIDEFVTSALRNNLLGLPLDLATINLARGRDTGVPSLNAARREFYEVTNNDARLKPYESWVDFAGNIKNEASIINFIAAYGLHPLITSQTTVEGKRNAAMEIIFGTDMGVGDTGVPADAEDFLNSTGAWASSPDGVTTTGLDNVDLWIGGLAEKILPFGGMLGSTFNFVFEVQMEQLQNGDRFYYLQRLDGLHLFSELEGNSFASMMMRHSDATHLPSDVFSRPGLILEVDSTRQFNDLDGDGDLESGDPTGGGILTPLVIRNNPGTVGPDTNYLRYTGDEHVVLGGTDGADIIIASEGDDTIFGDGGNDTLEGGAGNDIINAGDGDDVVRDLGGDDNIKLGDGHDVINTGPGLDLVLGGRGQDFIVLGNDAGSEVFAGEGNDFILGNITAERILGNEGDDWIEHGTFDGAPGDNFDEVFAQDGIDGHDVFFGLGGFDEFIGEGGDDIMVGSPGRGKLAGMSGWDWATYKDNDFGVDADLTRGIVFDENPTPPANATLDAYEAIEGLSGSHFDDILTGADTIADERLPFAQGGTEGYRGSALDADGIARIDGLQELLGAGVDSFIAGDILLGGDGSDVISGRGGDDIIDGDSWLNVRISVRESVGPNGGVGDEIATADSMSELVTLMFNRTYNPGQLAIVREILSSDSLDDTDVARFQGNLADYLIEGRVLAGDVVITAAADVNGDGFISVTDSVDDRDGTDRVRNVEALQFLDQTVTLTAPTDIRWLGVRPADGALPGSNVVIANLATVDVDNSPVTWSKVGGDANIQVSAAGAVSRTGGFGTNATYLVDIRALETGPGGGSFTETFTIRTGTNGGNTINGGNATDIIYGAGGNDTLNGGVGDDTLYGQAGNDTLNGGAGNDDLVGGGSGDAINGGAGDDTIRYAIGDGIDTVNGGADTDTLVVTAAAGNTTHVLDVVFNGTSITQLEGGAVSNVEAVTVDLLGGVDAISYTGTTAAVTVDLTAGTGSGFASIANVENVMGGSGNDVLIGVAGVANVLNGAGGSDTFTVHDASDTVTEAGGVGGGVDIVRSLAAAYTISDNDVENLTLLGAANINGTGNASANVLTGNSGNNVLNGMAGADTVLAGDGNDTINQTSTQGRDFIDGGGGSDTYQLTGVAGAETFTIFTRAAWDALAGNNGASLQAGTEIVVTRNGTNFASVIAELDNIEEISVNALNVSANDGNGVPNGGVNGGDTINVVGNFNAPETSLSFSTITVNGGRGNDTVNISGLTSDHRIVFNAGGGNDKMIGAVRPQDVLNGSISHDGAPAAQAGRLPDWADFARDVVGRFGGENAALPAVVSLRDTRQAEHVFARSPAFDYQDFDSLVDARMSALSLHHYDYLI
ncbi:hypothetical protein D1610_07835 [Sphingomonas gilva]|uniref:Heme peroxidase n=1 Tax=Sphingomonas gilva TaxID=2305907 RepID=A0A396RXB4_9SPHN|nr:peroxidase family protein [Sphingomonas gilva]RHW18361.1 hypothetical protein D1610_07835 [Sphingomonas gilva]